MGIGEKPQKRKEKKANKTKEKKFPIWLPSHPHFYDMEDDCFPMSKKTKNKLNQP